MGTYIHTIFQMTENTLPKNVRNSRELNLIALILMNSILFSTDDSII